VSVVKTAERPPLPVPPGPPLAALEVSEDALKSWVRSAFALGWHVAELSYLEDLPAQSGHRLRPLGGLESDTRRRLLSAQISADLDALGLERSGPVRPLRVAGELDDRKLDPIGQLDEIHIPLGSEQELNDLHLAILLRLTVKDFELGKAYSLGTGLGQTVLAAYEKVRPDSNGPPSMEEARAQLRMVFTHELVLELWSYIKDLKSRFPPYAADPVAATLWDWCKWAAMTPRTTRGSLKTESGDMVANRLRRQGQLWRALLSGERKPTDCLLFANYVDAASDLLRKYWKLAGRVLARRFGTVLLVIIAAGLALATLVAIQRFANNLGASIVGVLAALGVSGAGVVAALKRALSQIETALWETEITAAIAVAISQLPEMPQDSAIQKLRDDDPEPTGPAGERDSTPQGKGIPRSLGSLVRWLAALGRQIRARDGLPS